MGARGAPRGADLARSPAASGAPCAILTRDPPRPLAEPCTLVIFGASGDLAERKLLPALFSLACGGLLPEVFHVLGVARSALGAAGFREKARRGIERHARLGSGAPGAWRRFCERLHYLQADYDAGYGDLARHLEELGRGAERRHVLYYLATPPLLYPVIVRRLGEAGLAAGSASGWRRLVVEKPFGHDLASAVELNREIHQVFEEAQIYRIDHYLGKETVQNILVFRFANAIFEPLWNRNYIDHVQISMGESVSLGSRAGYYDGTGVLRDMFQNHLLQLLTLMAMEPPAEFEATALRDEKVKVLKALRPLVPAAAARASVRGQYRGYRDEKGVAPGSETATYAALRLHVDNWRWSGVPFYLRSGKALAEKFTEISVEFRGIPHWMFPLEEGRRLPPNVLTLYLQPNEGMNLHFEAKVPGAGMATRSVDMEFRYEEHFGRDTLPDAYERLLLDALQGDASLFTRSDEIELAWQAIDPILQAWEGPGAPPLAFYETGSWGPFEAEEFIQTDGRCWVRGSGSPAAHSP